MHNADVYRHLYLLMRGIMPSKILHKTPAAASIYGRAVLPKKANKSATQLPKLSYQLNGIQANTKKVKAYADVCGNNPSSPVLPPLFPHMIAFPICLELMLDKQFPFPLMGLVHVNNTVTQHRPIKVDELMDVNCRFGELKDHDKGKIVELIMEVKVAGEVVWESQSDMLARLPVKKKTTNKEAVEALEDRNVEWSLDSNLGRRYAGVSGDINPIHLYPITAKAFGFPRHIIHGMWTKARALSQMENELPDAYTVSVEFKLPVFLPSKVSFRQEATKKNIEFEVRDSSGKKPHMRGSITAH